MGDLETFEPSQAALDWLETKSRRERLPEKAKQQEWFLGVFQEPPLSKNKNTWTSKQGYGECKVLNIYIELFNKAFYFIKTLKSRCGIILPQIKGRDLKLFLIKLVVLEKCLILGSDRAGSENGNADGLSCLIPL